MRLFLIAAAATALVPAAASATTYDLSADYGASVFSYGTGLGATGFTPYTTTYAGGCYGAASFACQASGGNSTVPSAGVSSSAVNFATTVDLPANVLWMHPANGGGASDAVLRFTAADAGTYSLAGSFSRIDNITSGSNDPGNNGVGIAIFLTSGATTTQIYGTSALLGYGVTEGTSASYSLNATLGAGDYLSYVVSNNGNYYNDSTALTGTISAAVPEASTWAMMIAGFGLVGGALRRRTRTTTAFA